MDEIIRDDGFEASFVVSTPRAEAWSRLQAAEPAFDGLPRPREGQWWIPAIEAPADELDARPEEMLHVRKATEPCKGSEIVITLEDADSGTRIRIVQTGFGPGFDERRAWLATGWYPILADLVVFFERGVALGRHAAPWASLGCEVEETDAGLVVGAVEPDRLAAQAGVERGDLIVQLAGAPVLTIRDLAVLARGPLQRLEQVKVRVLRGDRVLSGTGAV